MSRLVKAVLLASIIGVSALPYQDIEAKSSLFQKLKDKTKGRASNEYTEELDNLIKALESFNKKLKTLVDQTAKLQENALPDDADFAMLMPLYCWSTMSEQFLSEIKVRLQELRDQYASVEGAENRKDKQESKKKQTARTGKAIDKEEAKIETAKQKMRQILNHLLWDKGVQGAIANIKCSILILLQMMEANSEPPSTHDSVLKNLISSAERYNDVFITLRERFESLLGILLEASDHEKTEGIEERIQQWINDVLVINDALNLIHQYFGGRPSNENTEIVDIQTLKIACTLSNRRRNTDSEDSRDNSEYRNDDQHPDREKADNENSAENADDNQHSSTNTSKKSKKSKKSKSKKNKKSKVNQEESTADGNAAANDQNTSATDKKTKKSKKSKSKKNKKSKSNKENVDTNLNSTSIAADDLNVSKKEKKSKSKKDKKSKSSSKKSKKSKKDKKSKSSSKKSKKSKKDKKSQTNENTTSAGTVVPIAG